MWKDILFHEHARSCQIVRDQNGDAHGHHASCQKRYKYKLGRAPLPFLVVIDIYYNNFNNGIPENFIVH